jgi:anti-anti-sigma regulatory factor
MAWHSLARREGNVSECQAKYFGFGPGFRARRLWKLPKKRTMLRITKIDTPTEQKLIFEGRLTEPWIADLSFHWEDMCHAHPKRKFVVDLRGVTRIDSRGESALALMKADGAEFLASGVRIKHLLEQLEGRGARTELLTSTVRQVSKD